MKTPKRGMIFHVFAGLLLVLWIAVPVGAQTAWTNTASGASGYWTNGVLWGTTVGNYPGSGASSAAYLTNNSDVAGGAYTAILNTTLNSTISTLVISNSNGEAWLIVTNGAGPATVLTNTTFSLGTGGRLQIDNGGVVTGITSFTWSGTNGTIVLNNGGQLFSTAAISLTAGRTGLVTTASSPGGVWNFGGQSLSLNSGAALTVSGVTLTNGTGINVGTVAGTGNSLTLSNGAKIYRTTELSVGVVAGANSNTVNVGGLGAASLLTNRAFSIGADVVGGGGGNFNTLNVSNATFKSGLPGVFNEYLGSSSTSNTVNILAGGTWSVTPVNLVVGNGTPGAVSTGNVLNINGGTVSNTGGLIIGYGGGNVGNGVTVANGGTYFSATAVTIGNTAGDNNNYFNMGGVGAASTATVGQIVVGNTGAGNNSLTLTNATLSSGNLFLGINSSNNTANVRAGGTWNLGNGVFVVGYGNATGNVATVNNGILTNVNSVYVGAYTGGGSVGNTMTISNGAKVFSGGVLVGGVADNNTLNIGGLGAASTWTNSGDIGVGAGFNTGAGGSFNTMTISNATYWSGNAGLYDAIGSSSTNNTVNVLAGGTWNQVSGLRLYVGLGTASAVSTGNVLNIDGGIVTNRGTLYIGAGTGGGGIGNGVKVSNGGRYISPGFDIVVGNDAGDSGNYLNIGGVGASSLVSNRSIYVGNAGGGNNTMTVTNALLMNSGQVIVGSSSSNNTVNVQAGGTWNNNASDFVIGQGAAASNVVTVNSGVLTNIGRIFVGGYLAGGVGNTMTISNGTQVSAGAVYAGYAPGINGNTLNIGGSGAVSTFTNNNEFQIGAGSTMASAGGNNNTLNVSNATAWLGTTVQNNGIGYSSTNNTVNVLANGTLNLSVAFLTIGNGTAGAPGSGNALNINGGIVSNTTAIRIGTGAGGGSFGNGLTIANGGQLINGAGAITVGLDSGDSNNYFNVGGVGAASTATGGQIVVGNAGAGNNSLTLTNATLSSSTTYIGINSSNNTANVRAGGTWNLGNGFLAVGYGNATGNVVTVNNGTLTNVNAVYVGALAAGSVGNTMTISNGATVFSGGAVVGGVPGNNSNTLNIGGLGAASTWTDNSLIGIGVAGNVGAGGSFNTMTISNATYWSGHPFFHDAIGSSSTNNTVNVLAGGAWTHASGNNLYVGVGTSSAVSTGNVVNVNGGIFTNISTLLIGAGTGGGGIGNGMNVVNGGRYISPGRDIVVGNDAGDSNNYLNVGGVGASSLVSNRSIYVGNAGGGNNSMTVTNALLLNSGQVIVGSGSSNNTATVTSGGTWSLQGNALYAGNGAATGNVVRVISGGVLEANTMTVGAGAGNAITNSGGVYQFTTATPTITPNGFGRIAISNGTISFRAITDADVFSDVSGTLNQISYSGANTFKLNSASNTASVAQKYTFDTGRGATNYTRLEMINGTTAYRNGDITIGSGGSMLVSNTTALVTGAVASTGSISVVNSKITWQSAVTLAGGYVSDPSTNTFSADLTIAPSGWLAGGAGDLFDFKKSLLIHSTNNSAFNLIQSTVQFSGGGTHTNQITGIDTGTNGIYGGNFEYGVLKLGSASDFVCFDCGNIPTNSNNGLYVGWLDLLGDTNLVANLRAPANINLYYLIGDSRNAYLNGQTYQLLDCNGGAGGFLMAAIPEPSALVFMLATGILLVRSRRR